MRLAIAAIVAACGLMAAAAAALAQQPTTVQHGSTRSGERCRARAGRGDDVRARALYAEGDASTTVERRIELFTRSLDEKPTYEASYKLGAVLEKAGRGREARACFMWAFGLTDGAAEKAQAAARVAMTYPLPACAAERINWLKQSVQLQRFPTVENALRDAVTQQAAAAVTAAGIRQALGQCDPSDGSAARSFGVAPSVDVRIPFAYDRADLTPEGLRQARELGRALAADVFSTHTFLLVGHTDSRGTDQYNDALSRGRAETVRTLLAREFPQLAGRIRIEGRGKRELLILGTMEEDHALNRRVQVIVE